MTKEEKNQFIDVLDKSIQENSNFYLADISGLSAEESSNLRRLCFKREVSLQVVKNTLLKKALERNDSSFEELYDVLKGNTSIMFTNTANAPAKVIKEFRKKHDKPVFKAAHLDESFYIGEEYLDTLSELKSKNEIIAEIIVLLQSPAKNVISSLQSGASKLSGIISFPTFNSSTSTHQYLYVNNRSIKDKKILSSIKVAYFDTIPKGRFPLIVLFHL